MHLFLVDETNRNFVANHFFIVGGLVFTEEQLAQVDAAVRAIRLAKGYKAGDSFKFDTNTRPEQVSVDQAREAKQAVIHFLRDAKVRLICYVVLHDLCKDQSYDTRMDFALNTLANAYHDLLVTESATGIMLMDRDNDRYDYLEGLFQHGLRFSGGGTKRVDDRIKLFGMTNDNASHLSSAADIALGAFRYCVNAAGGFGKDEVAREMFPPLAEMLWGVERDGVKRVGGYGFHPRPLGVWKPAFKERYNALEEALALYSGSEE